MAQATLLIIDNDPEFIHQVEHEAHSRGFHVLLAQNSEEGLDLARHHKPDAIALSVELQPESGWAMCNRLKRDPELQNIPLVITSSSATQQTFEKHQRLATRAQNYLHKPCEALNLVEVLAEEIQPASASNTDESGWPEDSWESLEPSSHEDEPLSFAEHEAADHSLPPFDEPEDEVLEIPPEDPADPKRTGGLASGIEDAAHAPGAQGENFGASARIQAASGAPPPHPQQAFAAQDGEFEDSRPELREPDHELRDPGHELGAPDHELGVPDHELGVPDQELGNPDHGFGDSTKGFGEPDQSFSLPAEELEAEDHQAHPNHQDPAQNIENLNVSESLSHAPGSADPDKSLQPIQSPDPTNPPFIASEQESSDPLTGPLVGEGEHPLSPEDLYALDETSAGEPTDSALDTHADEPPFSPATYNDPLGTNEDPLGSNEDFESFNQAFDQLTGGSPAELDSAASEEAQNQGWGDSQPAESASVDFEPEGSAAFAGASANWASDGEFTESALDPLGSAHDFSESNPELGGLEAGSLEQENSDPGDLDPRDLELGDLDPGDSDLGDSDLGDSDLGDSDLRDSDLGDSDLGDSDLRDSDLRDSDLRDSDLRDSDLRDLTQGALDPGYLAPGDPARGNLDQGDFDQRGFNEAEFGQAEIQSAEFEESEFVHSGSAAASERAIQDFSEIDKSEGREGADVQPWASLDPQDQSSADAAPADWAATDFVPENDSTTQNTDAPDWAESEQGESTESDEVEVFDPLSEAATDLDFDDAELNSQEEAPDSFAEDFEAIQDNHPEGATGHAWADAEAVEFTSLEDDSDFEALSEFDPLSEPAAESARQPAPDSATTAPPQNADSAPLTDPEEAEFAVALPEEFTVEADFETISEFEALAEFDTQEDSAQHAESEPFSASESPSAADAVPAFESFSEQSPEKGMERTELDQWTSQNFNDPSDPDSSSEIPEEETSRGEIEALRQKLSSQTQELAALREENASQKALIAQLEEGKKAAEDKLSQLSDESALLELSTKELLDKAELMASKARTLEQELEESRKKVQHLNKVEAELEQLKAELEKVQADSQAKLKESTEKAEKELADSRSELKEATERAEKAEAELHSLNEKLSRAKSSILEALG